MELAAARAALQPHHLPQLLLGFPLLLVESMGVNVQRRTGLGMTQQAGYRAHVHALGNQQTCVRMPLRYNYDKPEKPRRIKG